MSATSDHSFGCEQHVSHRDAAAAISDDSRLFSLGRLTSDIGDDHVVRRFVADYLVMLDVRLTTVHRLLSGADDEATRVALLSLETSSAMLEAGEVTRAAAELRSAVTVHEHARNAALFAALESASNRLSDSLVDAGFRENQVRENTEP